MSLLAMPSAASMATSRSRAESGTTEAGENRPGVLAPSHSAASESERRLAAVAAR